MGCGVSGQSDSDKFHFLFWSACKETVALSFEMHLFVLPGTRSKIPTDFNASFIPEAIVHVSFCRSGDAAELNLGCLRHAFQQFGARLRGPYDSPGDLPDVHL